MEIGNPLVSVVIPTYNRPDTLIRAIDSVLAQIYNNVEVIVVDDNNPGSEGRNMTEKLMARYDGNLRVKYIKHPYNKNGSAARNTGAASSSAKYIAFLDDDDEFLPEKISSQVNRLENLSDEWAICYSKRYEITNGIKVEPSENREGNLFLEALKRKVNARMGSNLLIRKKVFDAVGGFDESFKRYQDHEIFIKILHDYKVAYCDTPGLIAYNYPHGCYDYDALNNKFIESFRKYIDELPLKEQREVYITLNLQKLQNKLIGNHDIKGCLRMLYKGEVPFLRALAYVTGSTFQYIKRRI